MVTIEWEASGLYRKFSGEVGFDDLLTGYLEGIADPRFGGIRYIINDFSESTSLNLSHQEIEEAAAKSKVAEKWPGRFCIALVVAHEQAERAASEFIAARMTHATAKVFRSLAQAREWASSWQPRI